MAYKLGSLFDGSGGFPLAGSLCGIEPCWAAEVKPYPIAVTRSRFPNMKHLGDISKVNGAEIEPVDIITFGSPCQDLSVAGKRAGLKHEANGDEETTRSGLFMEAVRIIKEMRAATGGEFPRFALWENVPGAFSSQKGEDFRVVLEELIRIVEPGAVVPPVPKAGWAYADSYTGDGWSLAYRVFDAQYWGVPQRRRRIHLVADFRGECAREVLFERQGVRGYFTEGRTPWQAVTSHAQDCSGAANREGEGAGGRGRQLDAVIPYTLKIRSGVAVDSSGKAAGKGALVQTNKAAKLATSNDQYLFQPVAYSFDSLASNSMKSKNPHSGCRAVEVAKTLDTTDPSPNKNQGGIAIVGQLVLDDQGGQQISVRTDGKSPTLRAEMHGNVPCVMESKVYDARGNGDGNIANTLTGDHNNRITDYSSVVVDPVPIHDMATRFSGKRGDKQDGKGNGFGVGAPGDPMNTLTSGDRHAVAYCTDVGFFSSQEEVAPTLLARQYKDPHLVTYPNDVQYIVRRLTPTECARLQGFADRHGDIEKKDSFTEEEFRFWHEVRNTHAAINGKKVQDYTEAQMLTWYNKLHTDSAEYKMWGNGIALPPALYCMQGIVDVLTAEEDEAWLL